MLWNCIGLTFRENNQFFRFETSIVGYFGFRMRPRDISK